MQQKVSASRLDRLAEYEILSSVKPELEDGWIAAGRDAEFTLSRLAKSELRWKSAAIFDSRRVPKTGHSEHSNRLEIDLIVATRKQITAIEIKNWSGSIVPQADCWLQERRNGDTLQHHDPIRVNEEKLSYLVDYLVRKGIQPPTVRIARVILWNENCRVPKYMADADEIIMRYQVQSFLESHGAGGLKDEFLHVLLDLVLDREENKLASSGYLEAISTEEYHKLQDAIADLHSFDKLSLVGGKQIVGDLRLLKTTGGNIDLLRLKKGVKVAVKRQRSKGINLLKAVFTQRPLVTLGRPYGDLLVSAQTELVFHAAGEPQMRAIPLAQVESFERG